MSAALRSRPRDSGGWRRGRGRGHAQMEKCSQGRVSHVLVLYFKLALSVPVEDGRRSGVCVPCRCRCVCRIDAQQVSRVVEQVAAVPVSGARPSRIPARSRHAVRRQRQWAVWRRRVIDRRCLVFGRWAAPCVHTCMCKARARESLQKAVRSQPGRLQKKGTRSRRPFLVGASRWSQRFALE